MKLSDFTIVSKIGYGTYANVYRAVLNTTGEEVALKVIHWNSGPNRTCFEIINLYKLIGEENIVRLVGAFREQDVVTIVTKYYNYQEFGNIFLILDGKKIKEYMYNLLNALRIIAEHGIVHHDVKPENYLFDIESGQGYLCDFGLAIQSEDVRYEVENIPEDQVKYDLAYPENASKDRKEMVTLRGGTRGYRAPEVLFKAPYQTNAVDVWSAGVILLTIITRRYPFFIADDDLTNLCEISCIIDYRKIQEAAKKCGREIRFPNENEVVSLETLVKTLNSHYDQLGLDNSVFDLLQRMLDPDQTTRITAHQCLLHPFFK